MYFWVYVNTQDIAKVIDVVEFEDRTQFWNGEKWVSRQYFTLANYYGPFTRMSDAQAFANGYNA